MDFNCIVLALAFAFLVRVMVIVCEHNRIIKKNASK